MSECGAKTRTGNPCKGMAMANGRCRMHGGVRPVGIAHPGFKTGRYSQHLPSRLLATYEQSKRDPELLALTDEIALIDGRLTDLLARVETGESGAIWKALRDEYRAYRAAMAATDIPEMKIRLEAVGDLITRGVADEAAWSDLRATLEQRRKLVESERKRLIDMQTMVTAEQAAGMVRALVGSIREHVRDPDTLRAITADLASFAVA